MMTGPDIAQIIMAAGTLVTAIGGVIVGMKKLHKVEQSVDGIVTQLVQKTKSEATMVGHAEGKTEGHAEGKESEKAAQAGRDEAKAEGKAEAQAQSGALGSSSAAVIQVEGKLELTPPGSLAPKDPNA